ncbi:AraC family transcriptional regulator [Yinghuangia sp. YIM S09857]|uniref:helix-turn-helix transcriptional regulator n=1 Tax=Yinghuangia sp. YIM S09857 TaxID=3436929 RepID=UPI003F536767
MPGTTFAGSDLTRLQEALGEHLGPYHLRPLGPGRLQARLTVARSHDLVVATLTSDIGLQVDVAAIPDNAYFITLASGGLAGQVDSGSVYHGSHIVGPGRRYQARWAANRSITVIRLSRRLVEVVWREQGGRRLIRPLRFSSPLAQVSVRSGIWEALADAFVAARDTGLVVRSTAVNARFGQLFAQVLLASQPHIQPEPAPVLGTQAPHHTGENGADTVLPLPVTVLRALEFCHSHAREPLSVADIAAVAGLSVRRLQATFRTHLGTTPIDYVKSLRLAGAHADLKRIADGSVHETVTDVALRWGFTHLGRFSGTYRSEFGQLPSETARSARPPAQ